MPLSIESLRNLNKLTFIAVGIDPPNIGNNSWKSGSKEGVPWWKFSMFSASSLKINGNVEVENVLGNLTNGIFGNKIVGTAIGISQTGILGSNNAMVPQMDFSYKFFYKGSQPITLSLQGELVLQTSVVEDYLKPIEALAYLTLPRHGLKVDTAVEALLDSISSVSNKVFGGNISITDSIGSAYMAINAFLKNDTAGVLGSGEQGAQGWDKLKGDFKAIFGNASFLTVPPTFKMGNQGSGLDLRFGSILLSDIYIKSFSFDVPTLYYEGGFPAHIPVSLEIGTFRPLTADTLMKIMTTQAQQW